MESCIGDLRLALCILAKDDVRVDFRLDGIRQRAAYAFGPDGTVHLELDGVTVALQDSLLAPRGADTATADGRLVAPMHGRILRLLVAPGQEVAKGQPIMVLEAMKMEHEISAPLAGRIAELCVAEGAQVAAATPLALIDPS